jgi:hypothetical protein
MEMRAQIIVNVVPIFWAFAPNLLHDNNVGITYARTYNFRVELVRFVLLYFMAMFHFMVIVIEAPFSIAPTHTILGMKSTP